MKIGIPLRKSHVKTHTRTLKTGKVVTVREYHDKRVKREALAPARLERKATPTRNDKKKIVEVRDALNGQLKKQARLERELSPDIAAAKMRPKSLGGMRIGLMLRKAA